MYYYIIIIIIIFLLSQTQLTFFNLNILHQRTYKLQSLYIYIYIIIYIYIVIIYIYRIHTLLVKSMKASVPAQQITSVKQKEMLKHGGMSARIQIKILNQLNTSESFLIINSIGKYF